MQAIGIDMGGTTIKMGLFDEQGACQGKWAIPTRVAENGKAVVTDIATAIHKEFRQRSIDITEVVGIGMGVPGIVSNGVVKRCVNVGWVEKPLKQELESALSLPVEIANDANVAALGEVWQGGGKGYMQAVLLTLGTGIGSGVIIDGNIVVGKNGLAGEVGHMCVNPEETLPCTCGGYGCLEQYASATGIARLAGQKSAKESFMAAQAGDEWASGVIKLAACYLGRAFAAISLMIDPEVFIIGGGVSGAGTFFTEMIETHYRKSLTITNQGARIQLAKLGNDAGIYGAAKLVLKK